MQAVPRVYHPSIFHTHSGSLEAVPVCIGLSQGSHTDKRIHTFLHTLEHLEEAHAGKGAIILYFYAIVQWLWVFSQCVSMRKTLNANSQTVKFSPLNTKCCVYIQSAGHMSVLRIQTPHTGILTYKCLLLYTYYTCIHTILNQCNMCLQVSPCYISTSPWGSSIA